jgi:hypothetical protein
LLPHEKRFASMLYSFSANLSLAQRKQKGYHFLLKGASKIYESIKTQLMIVLSISIPQRERTNAFVDTFTLKMPDKDAEKETKN